MKFFFEQIFSSFGAVYDSASPFYNLVNESAIIHQQATVLFGILSANVGKIGKLADEWDNYFKEVWSNVRNRDHLMKAHDHYRHKMYRANRRIIHRQTKGKPESSKLAKYISRVKDF